MAYECHIMPFVALKLIKTIKKRPLKNFGAFGAENWYFSPVLPEKSAFFSNLGKPFRLVTSLNSNLIHTNPVYDFFSFLIITTWLNWNWVIIFYILEIIMVLLQPGKQNLLPFSNVQNEKIFSNWLIHALGLTVLLTKHPTQNFQQGAY